MAPPEHRRTEHYHSERHHTEHQTRGRLRSHERGERERVEGYMTPSPEPEQPRRPRRPRSAHRISDSSENRAEPRRVNPQRRLPRAPPIHHYHHLPPGDYSHPNPFASDVPSYGSAPGPPYYSGNAFAPEFQLPNPNVFGPPVQPMYRPGPPVQPMYRPGPALFGPSFEPLYPPNTVGPAFRQFPPPPPFDPIQGPPLPHPHYADFPPVPPPPPGRFAPPGGMMYPNPPSNNHHFRSPPYEADTSASMVGSTSTSSTSPMEREVRRLRRDVRHLKQENAAARAHEELKREVSRQVYDFRRY